jgi:RecB family endonuclease NucS
VLTEREMEDAVAADPQKYLREEGLELVDRQHHIGSYIFDLLFRDRHAAKLIVELQRGTLDRNHTYKVAGVGLIC